MFDWSGLWIRCPIGCPTSTVRKNQSLSTERRKAGIVHIVMEGRQDLAGENVAVSRWLVEIMYTIDWWKVASLI